MGGFLKNVTLWGTESGEISLTNSYSIVKEQVKAQNQFGPAGTHRRYHQVISLRHITLQKVTGLKLMLPGADRTRTDDLLVANQSLSQLSYGPISVGYGGGSYPSGDFIAEPTDEPGQNRHDQHGDAQQPEQGSESSGQNQSLGHAPALLPGPLPHVPAEGDWVQTPFGAQTHGPRWIRTIDLTVISGVLYQLSYEPLR